MTGKNLGLHEWWGICLTEPLLHFHEELHYMKLVRGTVASNSRMVMNHELDESLKEAAMS